MIPAVTSGVENFSAAQRVLLNQWFPGASVERNRSWGLVETTVLEMTHVDELAARLLAERVGKQLHRAPRVDLGEVRVLGPGGWRWCLRCDCFLTSDGPATA
jgi:hypothetical protein